MDLANLIVWSLARQFPSTIVMENQNSFYFRYSPYNFYIYYEFSTFSHSVY